MSNPFGNPYESQPPQGQPGQGLPPGVGGVPYPASPPMAAPQPYLTASQLPRPVAPRSVTIVAGLLWGLSAFMVVGVLMLLSNNSSVFYFGLAAVINAALAWVLIKRPSKSIQALTAAYAALWCLTGIGLLVSVPMLVLLLKGEAKEYFAAGDRWGAARAANRSR